MAVVEQVATMDDAARRAAELRRRHPACARDREHEMAIFLTGESRVMIQGITGSEGTQARRAGCSRRAPRSSAAPTPARPGQTVDLAAPQVPVFGTVAETMAATGADVSVVFVPARRHQGRGDRGDRRRDPAGAS